MGWDWVPQNWGAAAATPIVAVKEKIGWSG